MSSCQASTSGTRWQGLFRTKKFAWSTTERRRCGPASLLHADSNRPLRVLFVGALIQRKGIGYLLDAIDQLGSQVELTIVGGRFQANSRVDEACSRWRWFESLPHSRCLDLMQEADVLVLPSLTEGWLWSSWKLWPAACR